VEIRRFAWVFANLHAGRLSIRLEDLMNPTGKVALITGGAHRVGRAITLELARLGSHVVVVYHTSAAEAQETAKAAQAQGVEVLTVQADVSNPGAVEAMVETAKARFGGVDLLVNSASLFEKSPFPTHDLEPWKRVTGVQIDGPFYVTNALAPTMQARGGGVIVNILDTAIWRPRPNFVAHAAGKAALLAMTRQLALELAPDIRVNAVAPGLILPPQKLNQTTVDRLAQETLLKRWGQPQDVAHAVRYLIEADYVTGQVIVVDGGQLLAN
jgi:NAD(P)-dependent dehydrogenase (short-subunit alcohol dehydrogenase family)